LANAFEILWDAIHSDLPDLKIRLENYLAEGEGVCDASISRLP
jgi:hypothetical protein